jgi:hypothetical protein
MKWINAWERLPDRPKNYSGVCQFIIREVENHSRFKVIYRGPKYRGNSSLLDRYPRKYQWLDLDAESTYKDGFNDAKNQIQSFINSITHDR